MEDSNEFVFNLHDDIGSAAAEDDASFLTECFVDNGDLQPLMDCKNPRRVIVGRTGAGKSALIEKIKLEQENVIELSPHSLSLNYIANNNVIRFFEDAGVSLAPFYILLWSHIFVVELLCKKYNIQTENAQKECISRFSRLFHKKDHLKELAIEYLVNWGDKFWLTTEVRMRELTEKVQNELDASLDAGGFGAKVRGAAREALSQEQRDEIVSRGKRVVSEIQIRELHNFINILADDVFCDNQEHFYIVIDLLDEEWADDRIKYFLIKALIETTKRFRKIPNVKIISALRKDLLDKVLHTTRSAGFQEEKYESLFLPLRWSRDNLRKIVSTRINRLVRRRYTGAPVTYDDIFKSRIDNKEPLDYMLDRTFLRPRDIILFVNECIKLSVDSSSLSAKKIRQAEREYSYKRLQSLATEWQIIYPNLLFVMRIFEGFQKSFIVGDLSKDFVTEKFESLVSEIDDLGADSMTMKLETLYSSDGNFTSVRGFLIQTLYVTGFLGLKTEPNSPVRWLDESDLLVASGRITGKTKVHIHPTFWSALRLQ